MSVQAPVPHPLVSPHAYQNHETHHFSLQTLPALLLYLPRHHRRPMHAAMPTFLRNGSKRVGFSPHNAAEPRPLQSLRSHMDIDKAPNGLRSSSPARLLRHIKANLGRALSLFSTKRHSGGGTCGPSDPNPNHFVPPRDSHQSEALEDCIEFINSSHRKSL